MKRFYKYKIGSYYQNRQGCGNLDSLSLKRPRTEQVLESSPYKCIGLQRVGIVGQIFRITLQKVDESYRLSCAHLHQIWNNIVWSYKLQLGNDANCVNIVKYCTTYLGQAVLATLCIAYKMSYPIHYRFFKIEWAPFCWLI